MGFFLSCVMYSNRIRCPLSKISVKAYNSVDIVATLTHALVKHIASPTPASQSFSFNNDKLRRRSNSSLSKGLLRCDIVATFSLSSHQTSPSNLRDRTKPSSIREFLAPETDHTITSSFLAFYVCKSALYR